MSKTRAFIAGGIGTVALLAVGALPASAAEGDTTTTFTLSGGALTVTVNPAASLPGGNSGQPNVTGQIGQVSVSDLRGGTASWTAYVKSSAFSTYNGVATTNSTSVEYNTGLVNKSGNSTVTGTENGNILLAPVADSPVVTASAVVGNNTANWEPTLKVNLPSDSLAGNYSGVVHTSVA